MKNNLNVKRISNDLIMQCNSKHEQFSSKFYLQILMYPFLLEQNKLKNKERMSLRWDT